MLKNIFTVTVSYITIRFSLREVLPITLAILLLSKMCYDAVTSVTVPK